MDFHSTKGPSTCERDPIENLTSIFNRIYPLQDQIEHAWKRLVFGEKDSLQFDCVRQEIAESWLRSMDGEVPYDRDPLINKTNPAALRGILKENQSLISVVKSTLCTDFALFRKHTGFCVYLSDRNSILLFCMSNKEDHHSIDHIGLNLSEQTIGTNSHSLSILLDQPFLITSKENFNIHLQEVSVTVSVPIHSDGEEVIGALTFAYSRNNNWSLTNVDNFRAMISFQIGLVNRIEKELRKADQISSLYSVVCSFCYDSLILVNKSGQIQKMNSLAERLLGASEKVYQGKVITKVLGKAQPFLEAIKENKPLTNYSIHFMSQGREKDCNIQVIPCELVNGSFIRLSQQNTSSVNVSKSDSNSLNALYTFSDILGDSPKLINIKKLAEKYALTPHNIMLLGESGTGKELFAHAIHNTSFPEGPFISINCAALPRGLIESELFGYEGGSFTGADPKGRAGKLELADGGTLFLDEIGDMPLEFQPILLRVLESKRLMRIGGSRYIASRFRVISATNQNIQELVAQKKFREDLYYRLSSLKLVIPALRGRGKDIIMLARHFVRMQCEEYNLPIPKIDVDVYKALLSHDWPGNIRELQNTIGTALSLTENGVITVKDLPPEINTYDDEQSHKNMGQKSLEKAEKQVIIDALTKTGYNLKQAAATLGISRTTLYKKLRIYDIDGKN